MKPILIILALQLSINNYEWQIVSDDGPEPRYINNLVYAKNALLLYGGKNNKNKGFDDLWEWKDNKWNLIGKGAPKRWDHSFTYMNNLDLIFLFGGRTFTEKRGKEERTDLNDNWIYKNGQWKKLEIDSPEPRSSHTLTYFQDDNQVILFGGRNSDEIFEDTWIFDGINWNRLEIAGPKGRYGHTMTYDPESKTIFLFGGHDGKKLLNDFWAYNGEEWIEIKSEKKPSPRMAHTMQFDNNGTAILFGGWDNSVSGELWFWIDNQWRLSDMKQSPQARLSATIGYDELHNEFILFGGSTGFSGQFLPETWRLSLAKDKRH